MTPFGHIGGAFAATGLRRLTGLAAIAAALALSAPVHGAGDLAKQTPIEVTVDLGKPGHHAFVPNQLKFETGKLYKLILRNPSEDPHYFTSDAFTQMIFTRKVQVTQERDGKTVTLAELRARSARSRSIPGTLRNGGSCRSRPGA